MSAGEFVGIFLPVIGQLYALQIVHGLLAEHRFVAQPAPQAGPQALAEHDVFKHRSIPRAVSRGPIGLPAIERVPDEARSCPRIKRSKVDFPHLPRLPKTAYFQLGHSKDHRPDLPQVKVMQAVLDPLGMPVATDGVSGERADDPLYIPCIERVQHSLERRGAIQLKPPCE